jgi:aldose 1-epimerase
MLGALMIRASILAGLLAFPPLVAAAAAQPYSAQQSGDVVHLEDAAARTKVSIAPSVGNVAFEMSVNGTNILRFPYASLDEFRKTPRLSGIPFMGPWANRLDEQAFYANGTRYGFDMGLGNVRGTHPIHGFLSSAPHWKVIEARADGRAAWVTSRLEVFRQPAWMAQFPFAHALEMTYRLERGELEVSLKIENLSAEPMPVAVGFHPYFALSDSPRDDWTIAIGARTEWLLSPEKLPTGETRPIEQLLPDPRSAPLGGLDLDHVFGDLVRDGQGRAVMSVRGRSQRIDVVFGANYRAAVVYAPAPSAAPAQNRQFICFEPMAGITNALNLAHRGVYKELQSVAPGQVWQERFWVRPSGF